MLSITESQKHPKSESAGQIKKKKSKKSELPMKIVISASTYICKLVGYATRWRQIELWISLHTCFILFHISIFLLQHTV